MKKDHTFKQIVASLLLLRLILLGSAGSFVFSPAAVANPPAPSASGTPWYDPNDPNCKQGCTYAKANESLIELLHYTETKYSVLRDLFNGSATDRQDLRQEITGFCLPQDGTEVDPCWERYSRYSLLEQARIRRAIIGNEDSQGRLLSRRVNKNSPGDVRGEEVPIVQRAPVTPEAPRSPMTAHLPTFDELKARRLADIEQARQSPALVTQRFQQWLDSYPTQPSRDDYVKTKKILRDPDDPSRGFFSVIETNAANEVVIDEDSYNRATRAYQNAINKMTQSHRSDKDDMADFYRLPASRPSMRPLNENPNSLTRRAFNDSHGRIVDAVNIQLRSSGYALTGDTPARITIPTQPSLQAGATRPGSSARAPAARTGRPATLLADPNVDTRPNPLTPYTGNERVGTITPTQENQSASNGLRIHFDRTNRRIIERMVRDVERPPTPPSQPNPSGAQPVQQVNGLDLPPVSPDD